MAVPRLSVPGVSVATRPVPREPEPGVAVGSTAAASPPGAPAAHPQVGTSGARRWVLAPQADRQRLGEPSAAVRGDSRGGRRIAAPRGRVGGDLGAHASSRSRVPVARSSLVTRACKGYSVGSARSPGRPPNLGRTARSARRGRLGCALRSLPRRFTLFLHVGAPDGRSRTLVLTGANGMFDVSVRGLPGRRSLLNTSGRYPCAGGRATSGRSPVRRAEAVPEPERRTSARPPHPASTPIPCRRRQGSPDDPG
jgi:hypothetical protein